MDNEWRALALRLVAQVSSLIGDPDEAAAVRSAIQHAVADSDDAPDTPEAATAHLQTVLEEIVARNPVLRPWFELNRPLGSRGSSYGGPAPGSGSGSPRSAPPPRRRRWRELWRPRPEPIGIDRTDRGSDARRAPTAPPPAEETPFTEPSWETTGQAGASAGDVGSSFVEPVGAERPTGTRLDRDKGAEDTAYPRLDAPARVGPGELFTVTAGLRAEADTALISTGSMSVLPEIDLQVALQFDPLAFALLRPAEMQTIRRTAKDSLPTVDFTLVALAGDGLAPERRVEAKFLRDGQLIGFASRALTVGAPAARLAPVTPSADGAGTASAGGAGTASVTPRPGSLLDLGPLLAEEAPDLVVVVRPSADTARARLVFTAHGPHGDLADRSSPLSQTLIGEADTGTNPEQLGRDLRQKVMDSVDGVDLFTWLRGLGHRVHRSMPPAITAAIRQAVARGTAERPATILIISEEPYVPWELAADPDGWPAGPGGDSPFLGAHAAISRWFLGTVPPPSAKPVSALKVRTKALVTADYSRVAGASPLPEAEAEVVQLSTDLAPGVTTVEPRLRAVLALLDGEPAADLLHFALHGRFESDGLDGGLLLIGEGVAAGRTQLLQDNHVRGARLRRAPFVYLNACQLAASDSRALGDYAGLATSFLYAGAVAVVAPLWNVRDDTARTMAVDFYRQASAGEPPSAAEILRRHRARYTLAAVRDGAPGVDATLVAYQLFAHPRLTLDLADDSERVDDAAPPVVIDLREAAETTATPSGPPG